MTYSFRIDTDQVAQVGTALAEASVPLRDVRWDVGVDGAEGYPLVTAAVGAFGRAWSATLTAEQRAVESLGATVRHVAVETAAADQDRATALWRNPDLALDPAVARRTRR